MPQWVSQLVFDCKFLFPFHLRRRYFYCTSSGLARALQHLQQQQAAEGHTSTSQERELRVSRIQRQKVPPPQGKVQENMAKGGNIY
jgi:E3 ubiquitin-protein ligase TRIP12